MAARLQGTYDCRRQLRPAPLAHIVTTASRNDSPELCGIRQNGEPVPLVPSIRRYRGSRLRLGGQPRVPQGCGAHNPHGPHEGIYTRRECRPVWDKSRWSSSERGHLYRCNPKGCRLTGSIGGARPEVWEQERRRHQAGGVEGPVHQAAGQEGVQVDEGVETAGAALCPWATTDHPSRHDVGLAFQLRRWSRTGQADMMRWMVRKVALAQPLLDMVLHPGRLAHAIMKTPATALAQIRW